MHPDGCRTAPTRMPASAPSPSPVRIRRPASLRTRRSRRCGTCSLRSATPARSARPIAAGSERRETAPIRPSNSPKKWRAAYRAHTVGSDGHFVGFEPLTWQLHAITLLRPDRPPRPRRRRDSAENRGARAPVFADREARSVTWTKPGSPGRTTAKARSVASAAIPGWCGMAPA
jgi:hypothetical protein